MKMNHVLVVGTKELTSLEGIHSEPGKNIVQPGDYILSINDTEVTSKEQIGELVQESGGDKVRLRLQRDGETIEAAVEPVEVSGGLYQLGIWVKDDLAGVGTMTYFDENGSFGALGHGISDSDTGQMLAMGQGYLYHTTVLEISKSAAGEPGRGNRSHILRIEESDWRHREQSGCGNLRDVEHSILPAVVLPGVSGGV